MGFVIWEALSIILLRILLAIFGLSFYRFVFHAFAILNRKVLYLESEDLHRKHT